LTAPVVDSVELADSAVAKDLDFTAFTDYSAVIAGSTAVQVDAGSATAEESLDLGAGATYTVVVRDLESGLGVLPIQDFAAANKIPTGGVEAGLGGSSGTGSQPPWTLLGLALAAAGLAGLAITRRPRTGSAE
jgi:spore coat protein U-like protein